MVGANSINTDDADKRAAHQYNIAQAAILNWFAGLFIAPLDANGAIECNSDTTYEFLAALGAEIGAENFTSHIAHYFQSKPPVSLHQDLARQYVNLFDGVAGPRTIPPYESFYSNENGRLFQKPYDDMLKVMRKLDVKLVASCKEPPDHLALELASLAEALLQANVKEASSLRLRLLSWVPKMEIALEEIADGCFYHVLVALLVVYLSSLDTSVFITEPSLIH